MTSRPRIVLLVDDEPEILSTLASALTRHVAGVTVLRAPTARAALDVLSRQPVDLIVSDFRMPDMDGLELLTRVRETSPRVIRTMMTAYAEDRLAVNAVNEAGVAHFFTKPFRVTDAVAAITELLAKQAAEDAARLEVARAFATLTRA